MSNGSELMMKIYPNPVQQNDPIHLSFSGLYQGHVLHVIIIDAAGREILTDVLEFEEYHGVHLVHDLHHNLKPGTYVIKALNGARVSNQKLIVK